MEWSHGKMDPSWNSSPRLVDLTSFSAPLELVERLWPAWLITSELPERNNCDTSLSCWLEHRWFSQLIVPPPDTVHPRWPQFYIFSADFSTDYYRVCDHHNVVFKHSLLYWLLTVLSVSNSWLHWTYHVTLVMFRSVQFLEIIICNASNARIGLPIGANSQGEII